MALMGSPLNKQYAVQILCYLLQSCVKPEAREVRLCIGGGNRTRLTLLLCAALQVILKLILRIKLRTANGALIRLARFMFF
jgi:hypothetical protein